MGPLVCNPSFIPSLSWISFEVLGTSFTLRSSGWRGGSSCWRCMNNIFPWRSVEYLLLDTLIGAFLPCCLMNVVFVDAVVVAIRESCVTAKATNLLLKKYCSRCTNSLEDHSGYITFIFTSFLCGWRSHEFEKLMWKRWWKRAVDLKRKQQWEFCPIVWGPLTHLSCCSLNSFSAQSGMHSVSVLPYK